MLKKVVLGVRRWIDRERKPLDEVDYSITVKTAIYAFTFYALAMLLKIILFIFAPNIDVNIYLNEWYIFAGVFLIIWIGTGLRSNTKVKMWEYVAIIVWVFCAAVFILDYLNYFDSYLGWLMLFGITLCSAILLRGVVCLRKLFYKKIIGRYIEK